MGIRQSLADATPAWQMLALAEREGGGRLFTSICLEQTFRKEHLPCQHFLSLLLCPHWDEHRPWFPPTILKSCL